MNVFHCTESGRRGAIRAGLYGRWKVREGAVLPIHWVLLVRPPGHGEAYPGILSQGSEAGL